MAIEEGRWKKEEGSNHTFFHVLARGVV